MKRLMLYRKCNYSIVGTQGTRPEQEPVSHSESATAIAASCCTHPSIKLAALSNDQSNQQNRNCR